MLILKITKEISKTKDKVINNKTNNNKEEKIKERRKKIKEFKFPFIN